MNHDNLASANLVGDLHQRLGHLAVGFTGAHLPSERVKGAGVEAGRDQDELGLVGLKGRLDDALKGGDVGAVTGSRGWFVKERRVGRVKRGEGEREGRERSGEGKRCQYIIQK